MAKFANVCYVNMVFFNDKERNVKFKLDMNLKSFICASIAVFAAILALDYLVHHLVLVDMYNDTSDVWRASEAMVMWPMLLSQMLFALVFVYIFTRNYEARGLSEGVRYGLYIGLLFAVMNLGVYSYLPIPFVLVIAWMIASLVKNILLGIVAALVYRE